MIVPLTSARRRITKCESQRSLLVTKNFIGGEWKSSESGQTYAVEDPATRTTIAHVPNSTSKDVEHAISAAKEAGKVWKGTTGNERGQILTKWWQLVMKHQHDLARIITYENGKPLSESMGEISYGGDYITWFAGAAARMSGTILPSPSPKKQMFAVLDPVGVCGLITPWNFPHAMLARKIAPALAAGCTVVIKPSPETPLSALAMVKLASDAGVPPGVINIITCDTDHTPDVGASLTRSPTVRKISFTGSTAVGKLLMRNSSNTIKKLSLELGGNAPFIVFEDADIEKAADGLMVAKFRNAGQACIAANRIYVQEAIFEQFKAALTKRVEQLKVGNGLGTGVSVGPLINQAAFDKVTAIVKDALEGGARIVCGGGSQSLQGSFYPPTVLERCTTDMRIAHEEVFGPVAALFKFRTEEEVVQYSNDSPYGLAAYAYTSSLPRMLRLSRNLETGLLGINEGGISCASAPFGGVKESGLGREGGFGGLEEFGEWKYVCVAE
ncbi:succinic semialdehyde dehydrogenase [Gaertneriomyces semiglobifer]|nr:succinic semialdehyde dehydrogenase [Gaertneriomyces semiglobifer]